MASGPGPTRIQLTFRLRLVLGTDGQSVNLYEPFGGGMVELVLPVVGGETVLVKGLGSLPTHHGASPLVQPKTHIAGYEPLGALHVGVQVSPVGRVQRPL